MGLYQIHVSTYPYIPARNPNCIIEEICCQPDFRVIGTEGKWGNCPPPNFGRSVNPIQIKGEDYAPHTTASPPGFKKLSTPLPWVVVLLLEEPL